MRKPLPPHLEHVLTLLAAGYTREKIALEMHASVGTINFYIQELKKKLGDEPEIRKFKLDTALVLIGQRYFNTSNREPLPTVDSHDVGRAEQEAKNYYLLRMKGGARDVVVFVAGWVSWVESKERAAYNTSMYPKLLTAHAKGLYEQAVAYTEIRPPESVGDDLSLGDVLAPIAQKLDGLSQELKLYDMPGAVTIKRQADDLWASLFYKNHRYMKAIEASRNGLAGIDNKTVDDLALMTYRTLALCYTYRTQKEGVNEELKAAFKKVRDKIRRLIIINTGHLSNELVCVTLEGLARGEAIFHFPEAYKTIEESRTYLEASTIKLPFRTVEQIRGELEVIAFEDLRELEQRGNKGLQLAKEYGYDVHAGYIKSIMNKHLNK